MYVELKNINKTYGSYQASRNVNFGIEKGKLIGLLGPSGSGKTTILRMIAGLETPDSGEVIIDGERTKNLTPAKAQALGVATIYQETSLYPQLSVLENLFVGKRLKKNFQLDWKRMEEIAEQTFQRLGVKINLYEKMANLGKASAQLVEIAKALSMDAKILIMDEPTSSLSAAEVKVLFKIMRELLEAGISIVYISHRLEEIMEIGDHVTILRDGKYVDEYYIAKLYKD